jgi:hypothetical protein
LVGDNEPTIAERRPAHVVVQYKRTIANTGRRRRLVDATRSAIAAVLCLRDCRYPESWSRAPVPGIFLATETDDLFASRRSVVGFGELNPLASIGRVTVRDCPARVTARRDHVTVRHNPFVLVPCRLEEHGVPSLVIQLKDGHTVAREVPHPVISPVNAVHTGAFDVIRRRQRRR